MDIRYVKHQDLDIHKWDSCVHFAGNGNTYGYSWYLKQICGEWDALVEGDYVSVFPLIFNTKILGYKQLYHPQFAQQLGLFSVHALSQKRVLAFLEAIPNDFRRITINLNYKIKIGDSIDFRSEIRPNFQLLLSPPYEEIAAGYSKNMKRSLKKAYKLGLRPIKDVQPEKLVEMFKQNQGKKIADTNERSYFTLLRIIYQAQHRGLGFITGVKSKEGELIAAAFFLSSHGKLINLIPSTTAAGREARAMHFLLDLLIQANAGTHKILDFEGSSIPSIARFFQSFGAVSKPYPVIKRNTLPFWLKWALH